MARLILKPSHISSDEFADQVERLIREQTGKVSPAVIMLSAVSLPLGVLALHRIIDTARAKSSLESLDYHPLTHSPSSLDSDLLLR